MSWLLITDSSPHFKLKLSIVFHLQSSPKLSATLIHKPEQKTMNANVHIHIQEVSASNAKLDTNSLKISSSTLCVHLTCHNVQVLSVIIMDSVVKQAVSKILMILNANAIVSMMEDFVINAKTLSLPSQSAKLLLLRLRTHRTNNNT